MDKTTFSRLVLGLPRNSRTACRLLDLAGRGAQSLQGVPPAGRWNNSLRGCSNALAAVEHFRTFGNAHRVFVPQFVDPAHPVRAWNMDEIERHYDVMLVDMGGVLRDNAGFFAEAMTRLNRWQSCGKKVIIVSNTANHAPATLAAQLRENGFSLAESQIVTSGGCLSRAGLQGKKVFVLGNQDTRHYVEQAGANILDAADPWQAIEHADAFIIGYFDPAFTREVIEQVMYAQRLGKRVILPNPDLETPFSRKRNNIGTGGLGLLAEAITGLPIREKLGKPYRPIYALALEAAAQALEVSVARVDQRRILMVGDMLEYDIKGAQDFGIDSLLVLSGLDGMPHRLPELAEDMLRRQIFPTWVLRSIA